ncbi:MAG: MFS transporter [Anaerolineales bacterium]|nr:MFS transporter [Anaerolineales bacterium]
MTDTSTEKENQPVSRGIHRNIWIMAFTSFLTDVSSEMLVNVLPLFLYNVLGVKTNIIGLIDGIAETTASLVKIYSGSLSDRLGKRKTLAVIGYGLSTIAKPFLYFATTWGWVLGVRFADRVGKGIRTAPRDALLAGSAKKDQRGLAFGLHRAADTAGAFTGLGIAALIIWLSQSASAQLTRSTFQVIVLASIIPAVLAVLILALGARDVEAAPTGQKATAKIGWKSLDMRFRVFLIVVVLFTLGNSSDSFIILRGQERGLSVLQVMGMLLTFNGVYSLLSSPLGRLSDRIGRRKLMLAGWMIYAAIYLGFGLAHSGAQIWLLFGLYGIYYALTEGTAKALVADMIPQEQRGTAYGYFNAAIGFSALPASAIAGVLWQGIGSWTGFGPAAPFFFGASMALLASILLIAFARK